MNSYTISLDEVINQIWNDGHPDETHSIFELPSWKDSIKNIDNKIEYARPLIFSFDYECYGDEDDKKHLEQHILRKYLTREICCSSLARWQLYLYTRLNDIMPKYIPMYNANLQLIENAINVLNPYNITENKERTVNDTSTDNSKTQNTTSGEDTSKTLGTTKNDGTYTDNNSSTSTSKYSDTPQALMQTGKDYLTNLTEVSASATDEGENHNTTSNDIAITSSNTANGNSTVESSSESNKKDNYIKTIKGNMSKYNQGELVKSYYDSIISIEEMISNELSDLFYLMY